MLEAGASTVDVAAQVLTYEEVFRILRRRSAQTGLTDALPQK